MKTRIRRPEAADAAPIARMHMQSWRETYRGVMPDEVLDSPTLVAAREQFWTTAILDPRYSQNRIALAEQGDSIVGIAMSGPPLDSDVSWARQLYVLYVLKAHHGTGIGTKLLDSVLDPGIGAALWVADPNPRAQAFYRKHGFAPDGAAQSEDGVREIRMIRSAAS